VGGGHAVRAAFHATRNSIDVSSMSERHVRANERRSSRPSGHRGHDHGCGRLGSVDCAAAQAGRTPPAALPTSKDEGVMQQMTPAAVRFPIGAELPSVDGATQWLNSPPLTSAGLRGSVVLVDL
jgi:hypothetical protein